MTERAEIQQTQAVVETALKGLSMIDTQLAPLELECLEGATLELRRMLFRLAQRLRAVDRAAAGGSSTPRAEGHS